MQNEQAFYNRLPGPGRVLLTAALGASLLMGMRGDASPQTGVQAPIVQHAPDGCVAPSAADFAAIQSLEAQPTNVMIDADWIGSGKSVDDPQAAADAYRQAVANKNGLTIYDGRGIVAHLQAEEANGEQVSYASYLEATQEFMAKYGVDVTLATDDTRLAYGRPLTAQELNSPAFKATLVNLIYGYSNTPVEYVRLGGLKHIVLASDMAKDGVAAYTYMDDKHDSDYFDATLGIVPATFGHELGHDIDATLCGTGAATDAAFGALNGGRSDLYNGKTFNADTPNLDDYQQQYVVADIQAWHDATEGDVAAACQILKDQDKKAAGVLSVSEYHPNETEAKAELFSLIFQPGEYVDLLDPRYPVLKAQADLLLARLHAVNPALPTYLLDVSRHPVPSRGANCSAANIIGGTGSGSTSAHDPTQGLQK